MGRFINPDALASTGQGVLGNNVFAYCLNNPVIMCDSDGLRAVANTRSDFAGKKNTLYYSDGKGKSDDLLKVVTSAADIPSEYEDLQLKVYNLGVQFKETDHSLDYANFLLSETASAAVGYFFPPAGTFLGAASAVASFAEINDVTTFPDGYYDTYKVTASWTDSYEWDGGTTYTYHSYEFIVCWDSVSTATPNWQLNKTRNNSYSEVVYN